MTSYDEDEIAAMMARGYSREQAMQFTHRKNSYDSHDLRVSDLNFLVR